MKRAKAINKFIIVENREIGKKEREKKLKLYLF
jgi:hypothetical protein